MLNFKNQTRWGISKVSEGVMSFSGAISKALTAVFIASNAVINSYAAEESKLQLTDEQFKKLQSKLAYIDYAITANNAIALESDRTKWYTNIKYRKSIINEIGHAIEKCLLGQNKKENGIVVFWDKMSPKDFTQANYNAWLLYNYVDTVIKENKDVTLDKVAAKLEQYNDVDKERLEKAVTDIKKYLEIRYHDEKLTDIIAFYHGHDKKSVKDLPKDYLTKAWGKNDIYGEHDAINRNYRSKYDDIYQAFGIRYKNNMYLETHEDYAYNYFLVLEPRTMDMYICLPCFSDSHKTYTSAGGRYKKPKMLEFLKRMRKICINDLLVDHGYLTDSIIFEELVNENKSYEETLYIGKHRIISGDKYQSNKSVSMLRYDSYIERYEIEYIRNEDKNNE